MSAAISASLRSVKSLLISKEFEGTIHLLLTDVVMPRMSGRVVVEHLVEQRRGIKVLYMSGYTDDTSALHGFIADEAEFIGKPFSPDELARKVRRVLDRQVS